MCECMCDVVVVVVVMDFEKKKVFVFVWLFVCLFVLPFNVYISEEKKMNTGCYRSGHIYVVYHKFRAFKCFNF